MSQIQYLVDQFDRAAITGAPDSVVVRDIAVVRDSRIAIFQHPNSEIVFPPRTIGAGVSPHFGIGMLESVWSRKQLTAMIPGHGLVETPSIHRLVNNGLRRP